LAEGRAAYTIERLERWMRPESRDADPAFYGSGHAFLQPQPKGVVGNIAPWNFPFDISRVFGEVYADMARMEALLAESDLEWTAFCPPRLTDGRATGRYRTAVGEPLLARARSSIADLATAMLAAVDDHAFVARSVPVAA
jgi:hypothetical protein